MVLSSGPGRWPGLVAIWDWGDPDAVGPPCSRDAAPTNANVTASSVDALDRFMASSRTMCCARDLEASVCQSGRPSELGVHSGLPV